MKDNNTGISSVPTSGGAMRDLVMRLKLIVRLMGDGRVSPFLKLLPIASLVYLISPVDLVMGIPGVSALDDMAIVSLGAYLFVEFCPSGCGAGTYENADQQRIRRLMMR